MDFEYGCAVANKYGFFDENEVEDPSELLAQATKEAEPAKTGKDAKQTKTTGQKQGQKTQAKQTQGGKQQDAKKQPLQQQTDNSVKSQADRSAKPKSANNQNRQPRENKENNKQQQGQQGQTQQQGGRPEGGFTRRPRPEGGSAGGQRQQRPAGQEGGFRDRPPRQRRPENAEGAPTGGEEGAVEGEGGFRRQGGVPRGPRGPYRGGHGGRRDPNAPRQFERHSGSEKTGVKAVDKKDGAGKANWGTPQDELAAEEIVEQLKTEETETPNWAEQVEQSEEAGKDEEEDKPQFLTLDEYKALKNEVNKKNEFNIRKPGEGEDMSKWGKTYVLQKKRDEEEEEEEEEEEVEEEEEEEDRNKNLLSQIQIKFNDARRGERRGGERRGFGGDRRGGEERRGERRPPREEGGEERRGERRPPREEGGAPAAGGERRSGNFQRKQIPNQPKGYVPKIEDFPTLGK